MKYFKDIYGRNIKLTDERLEHLEDGHPEMVGQVDKIEETLAEPVKIIGSKTDEKVELFHNYYHVTPVVCAQYLCVVVKLTGEKEGFVLTAYFTNNIKQGEIIWEKR